MDVESIETSDEVLTTERIRGKSSSALMVDCARDLL